MGLWYRVEDGYLRLELDDGSVLEAGVPMPTLKAWMGHSRLETTMRYAIYAPPERSSRYMAAMADMGLSGDPTRDDRRSHSIRR